MQKDFMSKKFIALMSLFMLVQIISFAFSFPSWTIDESDPLLQPDRPRKQSVAPLQQQDETPISCPPCVKNLQNGCVECVKHTNIYFDCRPLENEKVNQDSNCAGLILGIACFPFNVMWRTSTCLCQDSMNCCDVLCIRAKYWCDSKQIEG